jgi:hypothetical protein
MDFDAKLELARKDDTPVEVLEELAVDKDWHVRCGVAENPNTPIKTLELLATDESHYVRYWVAQNPNRTELIERLVLMTNYKQEVG